MSILRADDEKGEAQEEDAEIDQFWLYIFFVKGDDSVEKTDNHTSSSYH